MKNQKRFTLVSEMFIEFHHNKVIMIWLWIQFKQIIKILINKISLLRSQKKNKRK